MKNEKVNTVSIIALLLLCLFNSCNKDPDNGITPVTKIDIREYEDIALADLLDASEFVPLEYSEESVLPHGMLIPNSEGFFYKNNRHNSSVFYFDESGNFMSKIGVIGKGPGEFTYWEDIIVTENEVIFQSYPGTIFIRYDYQGNFIKRELVFEKGIGSIVLHPENGDYYIYSPMWDYLVYQINPDTYELVDSVFVNEQKTSAHLPSLWPTSLGSILFSNPLGFSLDIFEIKDSTRLKYILIYGLGSKADDRWDKDAWSNFVENNESRDVRRLLENQDWLYICSFVNDPQDDSKRDFSNLLYHKKSGKTYRLPGHLLDNTYFDFAFRLDEDNILYTTISMPNIMDNGLWLKALNSNNIEFNLESNPMVVKIYCDKLVF